MFQGRKLLTFLVSLLAAVILWLYVVTTIAPEASTRVSNIPIAIDGTLVLEQRGLTVTQQDITEVSLDLSASRMNISKLNAASIRVSADASRIREPGTYDLDCTVTFPDTVRSGDVDLLRKSSDTVRITVSRLDTKPLPVRLDWTGSVREGYVFELESSSVEPGEVTLTGPDYELEKITEAVARYDISDLEQTETVVVPLQFLDENHEPVELSELCSVSVSEVAVTLPVLRTRQIALNVALQAGGGVRESNATVTMNPPTIRVKGSAVVLDAMDDSLTVGTVDLSAISDHEDYTFNLVLPAGVTCASGETEVQVSVDISGVSTDTIPVSDIRLVNIPEGYYAEVVAKTVQVTIRGSQADINLAKRNKNTGVYVIVDLENYTQTGAVTVAGKVMNPQLSRISVVETVEVGVVITSEPDHGS